MKRVSIFTLVVLGILGTAGEALSAGFQTYFEQSAAAMAQAAAVVARASDPSGVFYNPALSYLLPGTQVHVNVNGLTQRTAYVAPSSSSTANAGGNRTNLSDRILPFGSGHVTHRYNDQLSFGLAFNTPYGSETEWPSNWCGRYYAGTTGLETIYTTPSLAAKLTENLVLGIGVSAVWGRATVEKAVNAPLVFAQAAPDLAGAFTEAAFISSNDIEARMTGDDWGYGAQLGVYWDPLGPLSFGAAYQSEVTLDLTGRAKYSIPPYEDADFGKISGTGTTATTLAAALFPETAAGTRLTLPATMAAGIAFHASENLTVETDLMWTEWSSYNVQTVTYESFAGEADVQLSTVKDWKNTMTYRFGLEYLLNETLVGRAGYAFDKSPIPDSTRDPSLPGADRHDLSVGLGFRSWLWRVDVAYLYAMVDDSISRRSETANGDLTGTYEASAHVLSGAVSYRF